MENQREDLVVILAGYKERMDIFYESNPGLASRIANHVHFPDYSAEELLKISKMMLEEQQYKFSPEAEAVFLDYIKLRMDQPLFANARSVKNALDRARMRQANRIFELGDRALTKVDLVTLVPDDILQSRLFAPAQ
jgi:Cdc6-like AAA superfamily ATPase